MPIITLRFSVSDTEIVIIEALKRKPSESTNDFLCLALQAGLSALLEEAGRDALYAAQQWAKSNNPATPRGIHFQIVSEPGPGPKLPPIGS